MNRRRFLQASAAATLAGVAGCGGAATNPTGRFAGRSLRVFVYAGGHEATMRATFVPHFEALTGASVTLYPGWWDGMQKLKAAPAGDPPFDLMITDATQGYPAAKEGRFAQLDWANVPNKAALAPAATDHWVTTAGHGLTYPDAVMTLAYRHDAAPTPPARWGDLLRPEFAGKLGLYNHFYLSLYTFACVLADQDGNKLPARTVLETRTDEVFKLARDTRTGVKLWWPNTTDMILALVNREVAAGNMHSPEYLQALKEKPALAAVVPATDRAFVQVFWAVPAGSPNRDIAEAAINELFSHEVQLAVARRGSATARPDTAAQMAAEDPRWAELYPHTPDQFRTLAYYPYDWYAGRWEALADRWDRTVLRGG